MTNEKDDFMDFVNSLDAEQEAERQQFINKVTTFTDSVAQQFHEHRERVIIEKMRLAHQKALQDEKFELAELIDIRDYYTIEEMAETVKASGYTIEIHRGENEIKADGNTFNFDFSDLKIVIKQTVMEI